MTSSPLANRVPAAAQPYCEGLLVSQGFDFRLRKARATKAGDYTFKGSRRPRITVNQDLDPFLFLITYVHEVAHHIVHRSYGDRVENHGAEWKRAFQELMEPVMNESVFPADLLAALRIHLADPMASNYSDPVLMKVLRRYDPNARNQVLLADVPEGSVFGFRRRWFRKGKTKRTRALCQEIKSRKRYFVPIDAVIENVQLGIF